MTNTPTRKLMPEELIDNRIHLIGSIHMIALSTACGAVMQPGGGQWDNEINYWGKIGVRKSRPFTTITLDHSKVTCRRKGCKQ